MSSIIGGRLAVASAGLFAFPFLLLGCGPDVVIKGAPVTGKVMLDGAPLDQGSVAFTPAAGGDGGSIATVTAGSYSLPPENGLPPGRYVVRINSVEGGADPNAMPGESKPAKERIPKSWNSQSKHEIEVVEGDNVFPFEVSSKG